MNETQKEIVDNMVQIIKDGGSINLLSAPTGSSKTAISMNFMKKTSHLLQQDIPDLKIVTLFLAAPSLLNQHITSSYYAGFQDCAFTATSQTLPSISKKVQDMSHPILLMSPVIFVNQIQKLLNDEKNGISEILKDRHVNIIIDEIHTILTVKKIPRIFNVLSNFYENINKYCFFLSWMGISATIADAFTKTTNISQERIMHLIQNTMEEQIEKDSNISEFIKNKSYVIEHKSKIQTSIEKSLNFSPPAQKETKSIMKTINQPELGILSLLYMALFNIKEYIDPDIYEQIKEDSQKLNYLTRRHILVSQLNKILVTYSFEDVIKNLGSATCDYIVKEEEVQEKYQLPSAVLISFENTQGNKTFYEKIQVFNAENKNKYDIYELGVTQSPARLRPLAKQDMLEKVKESIIANRRVIVVVHDQFLQGHNDFNVLFSRLILVGDRLPKKKKQAEGRFGRPLGNADFYFVGVPMVLTLSSKFYKEAIKAIKPQPHTGIKRTRATDKYIQEIDEEINSDEKYQRRAKIQMLQKMAHPFDISSYTIVLDDANKNKAFNDQVSSIAEELKISRLDYMDPSDYNILNAEED